MVDEPYSVKRVVREIECDIAYLEDAPDKKLEPFIENLDNMGKRLQRLRKCLSRRMDRDTVNG